MEKDRHKARCNSVYDQNPFLLQDDPDQGLLSIWNKLHFSLRGRRSSKNEPVKLINSSFTVLITPPLKVARVSTLTRVLLLPFLVYQFPALRRSRGREKGGRSLRQFSTEDKPAVHFLETQIERVSFHDFRFLFVNNLNQNQLRDDKT